MLDGGGFGSFGAATTYYTGALQRTTYRIPAYRFEAVRLLHEQAALRAEARSRDASAALRARVPPRQGRRGARPRPGRAAPPQRDRAVLADRQPPSHHELRSARVRRAGGRGLRLPREARPASARPRRRLRRERLPLRRRAAHLLQRHVPVGGADQGRPGRRRDGLLDGAADIGQGSTSVLAYVVAEVLGLAAGGHRRRHGGHRPDADRPGQLLEPRHLHGRERRGRGGREDAGPRARGGGREARGGRRAPGDRRRPRLRPRRPRARPRLGAGGARRLGAARARSSRPAPTGRPPLAGPYKGSGVGISPAYSFTAAVVELECDVETGLVTVDDVWVAHDVGRAINPLLVIGQTEGSVYMALGEALLEEQTFRDGLLAVHLALRLQVSDGARDARGAHAPRRDDRSRRPVRGEGGGPGAAPAGDPGGRERPVRRRRRADRRGADHPRQGAEGARPRREGEARPRRAEGDARVRLPRAASASSRRRRPLP